MLPLADRGIDVPARAGRSMPKAVKLLLQFSWTAESKSERILKIGHYLPKLWTNNIVGLLWLTVFMPMLWVRQTVLRVTCGGQGGGLGLLPPCSNVEARLMAVGILVLIFAKGDFPHFITCRVWMNYFGCFILIITTSFTVEKRLYFMYCMNAHYKSYVMYHNVTFLNLWKSLMYPTFIRT